MKSLRKQKKRSTKEPLLHKDVQYKFAMFLQHFPPTKFNRELRNMFIDYLAHSHINYRLNRETMIEGVWDLLRVLDEAENHWTLRDCDDIIRQWQGTSKLK